ncbi:MAG TPA: site-specific integrase [Thermaerobacter sp.]
MRGHIRKRGRSWAVVIYEGKDEATGRKRYRWYGGFRTRAEAERELARLLNDWHTGTYVQPERMTVAEYLRFWLEDVRSRVAPTTYQRYAIIVEQHLIPALGRHPLQKLHPAHIHAYYQQALVRGRRNGRGGLSKRTVLHHHRVLHAALEYAVRLQLLPRNPADVVRPPRPEKREMQVLDPEGVQRLLEAARHRRLYVAILLAVTTGMRRGEILALRWEDVDLEAGVIRVRQTLVRTKEGLQFTDPKTDHSRRVIRIGPAVVQALRRHRAQQAEEKLRLGPAYQDHGLVVARTDGQPYSPGEFSRTFTELARQAGVPHLRFHDLRHTHATLLLRAGTPIKAVTERLGHASAAFTLDTYGHSLPDMQEAAARVADELVASTQSR